MKKIRDLIGNIFNDVNDSSSYQHHRAVNIVLPMVIILMMIPFCIAGDYFGRTVAQILIIMTIVLLIFELVEYIKLYNKKISKIVESVQIIYMYSIITGILGAGIYIFYANS